MTGIDPFPKNLRSFQFSAVLGKFAELDKPVDV